MAIITCSDFIGEIHVSINEINRAEFQAYIDRIVPIRLEQLMGDKLYNEYVADLDGNGDPQTQKYIDLVNGVTYTDCNGNTVNYEGVKRMLRYFVFSDYKITSAYKDMSTGTKKLKGENSDNATWFNISNISKDFNDKGVVLYHQAVKFIYNHIDTYFTNQCDWTYVKLTKQSKLKTVTTWLK